MNNLGCYGGRGDMNNVICCGRSGEMSNLGCYGGIDDVSSSSEVIDIRDKGIKEVWSKKLAGFCYFYYCC